jgi:hypothetical protein
VEQPGQFGTKPLPVGIAATNCSGWPHGRWLNNAIGGCGGKVMLPPFDCGHQSDLVCPSLAGVSDIRSRKPNIRRSAPSSPCEGTDRGGDGEETGRFPANYLRLKVLMATSGS